MPIDHNGNDTAHPGERFLLFEYDAYYPGGASSELTGCFPTLDAAHDEADKSRYDCAEIYDTWTGEWH